MNPEKYPEGYALRISDHFLNHVAAGVDLQILFEEIKDAYERCMSNVQKRDEYLNKIAKGKII